MKKTTIMSLKLTLHQNFFINSKLILKLNEPLILYDRNFCVSPLKLFSLLRGGLELKLYRL